MTELNLHRTEDNLTPRLRRAVSLLRSEVDPGALWRARLHEKLAGHRSGDSDSPIRVRDHRLGRVQSSRRSIALRVAAAVLLFAGGVFTGTLLQHASPTPPLTAVTLREGTRPGVSQVRFLVVVPGAKQVSLVGDFNGWNQTAMPMQRGADGRSWTIVVELPEGKHVYALVVDGGIVTDPSATRAGDDDFGVPSSVLVVPGPVI